MFILSHFTFIFNSIIINMTKRWRGWLLEDENLDPWIRLEWTRHYQSILAVCFVGPYDYLFIFYNIRVGKLLGSLKE